MRIANQFYTTTELEKLTDESVLCQYSDRDNCLHNMFWHIYDLLESSKKIHLIIESEEDLNTINYLISKYALKDLVDITIKGKPIQISESENPIPVTDNNHRTEVVSRFNKQMNAVKRQMKEFSRPCHGNMSIVELYDRQLISPKETNFSIRSKTILSKIDHDDLQIKKKLLRDAQEKYEPMFRHLDKINPFANDVIHTDLSGVNSYLSDAYNESCELLAEIDEIEQEISFNNNRELISKVDKLKEIENEIGQLYQTDSDAYSDTERKKILFYLNQLATKIGYDNPLTKDLNRNIKDITERLNDYVENQKSISSKLLIDVYQKMTVHSSEYDIKRLIDKLALLQQRLNTADIFSKDYNRKALSFYNVRLVIEDIKNDIDYALFFLDSNENYLLWCKYKNSLSEFDRDIISIFLNQKSSWEDGLEDQLSHINISNSLLRISSVVKNIDGLQYDFKQCLDAKVSLASYYKEDSGVDSEHSDKPLQIFFKTNLPVSYQDTSNVILVSLNCLPENTSQYNRVKVFAYSQDININTHSVLKAIPDMEILNDKGVFYSFTKKLGQLKSHELNIASLYLGQTLARLNPNYNIYKLKSVAIVSFLSEYKNAQLREDLYDQGIKEIFSSIDDYNLLPGIFSDTDVQPVILIEDGLIDNENEDTFIKQILIIEELKIAGVEVIVIDNNKLIKKESRLSEVTDIIAQKNRL